MEQLNLFNNLPVKASKMKLKENKSVFDELGRSYRIPVYKVQLVRESSLSVQQKEINSPDIAYEIFEKYMVGLDREHFVVMMLDTKHKVIGIHTVSIGSLNSSIVHPREVFKPAILSNANSVILAHNHPSGNTSPSPEDIAVTKNLVHAGEVLKIEVLDHIIIGDGMRSMKQSGDI